MSMSKSIAAICILLLSGVAYGADKSKPELQIDAAKASIAVFSAKAGDNKLVAQDLEQARSSLKKAEDAYSGGRQMFGLLGGIKPEAEQDIKHYTGMAELALAIANSKLEKAKSAGELEILSGQVKKLKARVKVFEDRKADLEKMKAEAAKYEMTARELALVKAEKEQLAAKLEKLTVDHEKTEKNAADYGEQAKKLDAVKAENSALKEQLDKLAAEKKVLAGQLEDARKAAVKTEPPLAQPIPQVPAPVPVQK